MGRLRGVVGMEWSAVATVWEGRRTGRPRCRSPVKACGLVTSWTRWRSTARTAGAPGSWVTTWSAQILSTIVRGAVTVIARAYQQTKGSGREPLPRSTPAGHEDPRFALRRSASAPLQAGAERQCDRRQQ